MFKRSLDVHKWSIIYIKIIQIFGRNVNFIYSVDMEFIDKWFCYFSFVFIVPMKLFRFRVWNATQSTATLTQRGRDTNDTKWIYVIKDLFIFAKHMDDWASSQIFGSDLMIWSKNENRISLVIGAFWKRCSSFSHKKAVVLCVSFSEKTEFQKMI